MCWLKLQRDTYQLMQYYTYTEVSAKKIQIKLCLPGLDKLRTWCCWARSGAWNLWSALKFSGAHILPCKKKPSRPTNFRSNRWNSEKVIVNSKYDHEHKWTCNILIMFTYLMMSKLTYLLIDWEIFNYLH